MFCPKCGAQVPDGTKFCPSCGAALNAAAPASGPTPNPGPVSSPVTPVIGAKPASPARGVKLVAAVVMIVSFFLPLAGLSIWGYEADFSAFQGTVGLEVLGTQLDGVPQMGLFVVPGVIALLVALFAKGKASDVVAILCGLGILALLYGNVATFNDELGGVMAIDLLVGAWLFVASGIASIIGGAMGLIQKK